MTKSIVCNECSEPANISPASYSRQKKAGYFRCQKCARLAIATSSKRLWDDHEYRSKIVAAGKKRDRQQLSINSKSVWARPEYRSRMRSVQSSDDYRTKMKEMWNRPGFRDQYIIGREAFSERAKSIHHNRYDYSKVEYVSALDKVVIVCPDHGDFTQLPHNHLYNGNGCPKCIKAVSQPQQEIIDFVKSVTNSEIIVNDRQTIAPFELDLVIPNLRLAIEHHGMYWHSYDKLETASERNFHRHKLELAAAAGFTLIQIFESEWLHKRPIVESMLRHRLGASLRLYARCCDVVEISNRDAGQFLNENHLQGARQSKFNFGLVHNGLIVSVLTVSYHSVYGFEIIRYATLLNHGIIGGFGKLLAYAKSKLQFKSIMTYADRRYSSGGVYLANGFEEIGRTNPGYCYIQGTNTYSRQRFQKSKLSRLLQVYNPSLSEAANMFNNGYRRLWDAGHCKLVKNW